MRYEILTSVEGIYRNGWVELGEQPTDVSEGTQVIVTFVSSDEINLAFQGINKWYELQRNLSLQVARDFILENLSQKLGLAA
ncbi:hypothetical protein IQ259_25235 [Fortiea sp. LEGE XX443]|uniref:hypothetical protein n=1 Tax=Fortiea sp. LEGE XX443 TaxID=1828611 RepID=UPI001882ECAB|nr:hypothetical protein [Fortiea sp. LEGE XX443]MBE9008276.1 hypothetical protein [Fortiea sp. LEGE XX443]